MVFNRRTKRIRRRHNAWLYSVVFNGAFSTCAILLLFTSFLIQPFHKAFAAEPAEAEEAPPPAVEDVAPQEELVQEDVPTEQALEQPPDVESSPPSAQTETDTGGSGELEVVEEPPPSEETLPPETSPPENAPAEETTTESSSSYEDVGGSSEYPVSEEVTEDLSVSQESVSTDGATTTIVQVQNLVTEDNFYQFGKNACVSMGDGAYHCSTGDATQVDMQSSVYAAQGESGNMEIFLKTTKNKVKQITENEYDDTSPHYDPESMRVVWHRLIDGRYQIIMYDIMEDSELQLTFSKTNNMEPKVSDAGIVWQAWDNHDWEIMYFDGTYTEQLTDNDSQDVAPVIQDGYVLWNVLGGDEQQARVYSIKTKETTSIVGYEGGTIINPRFVLVYDTEYENGDIVTQSFDPATGISEPIAAQAAPEPIDIPENDPTGEIRALLTQGKSQKEESELGDITDDGNTPDIASTTPGTLDLKQGGDAVEMQVAPAPEANFELTEYDLVITEHALEEALRTQE